MIYYCFSIIILCILADVRVGFVVILFIRLAVRLTAQLCAER